MSLNFSTNHFVEKQEISQDISGYPARVDHESQTLKVCESQLSSESSCQARPSPGRASEHGLGLGRPRAAGGTEDGVDRSDRAARGKNGQGQGNQ